jgi:1,2-phenylacetyl-CoA epoxidase catalytic subunit
LAAADGAPRDRLVAALERLGPDAATVFTPLADEAELVRSGILAAPLGELETRWRATIEPTLTRLGLPLPPPMRDPASGRTSHAEAFDWLWSEFTSVRRGDPEAGW